MLSAQGLGFVQGIQGLNVKCSGFRVFFAGVMCALCLRTVTPAPFSAHSFRASSTYFNCGPKLCG